ncbi:MAG: hypothetical protein ACLFNS_10405 [Desulfobacterales bacterium]
MNFKIWFLNVFLAALIAVSGFRIMHLWEAAPQAMVDVPSPKKESRAAADAKEKNRLIEERAYELLVRQNLFAPDRQEYVPETNEEEPEPEPEGPKISGEKVVLYGIIITGGRKTALINNPGGKLGDGKFKWVEEGQAMSNLKVTAIHPEEIVLNDGSEEYQILLSEKKQRSGSRKEDKGSGPTVVSGGSSPQKIRSSSASSGSDSSRESEGSSGDKSSKTSGSDDSDSEDKYKLVDTPFGTRRVKVE